MKRIVRDPLFHFAVAGVLLFCLHAWRTPGVPGSPDGSEVRVGAGDVEWLEATWQRQWQRPPTAAELRGLVADLVKEELLAREARAIGLDENDTVIRRRLAQKLEFLVSDSGGAAEPSEAQLRAYYDEHADRFATPARVSFTQILFRVGAGVDAMAEAARALECLADPGCADASGLGDASMIPREFDDEEHAAVARQLGGDFAAAVMALEPGSWRGPLTSTYGVHLVHVRAATPAARRPFDEARPDVLAAMHDERERLASVQFFEDLLRRYSVVTDDGIERLLGRIDGALLGNALRATGETS